jgi:hypothetical protein
VQQPTVVPDLTPDKCILQVNHFFNLQVNNFGTTDFKN